MKIWLSGLNEPDEGDRVLAVATVEAINRAYDAGLEARGKPHDKHTAPARQVYHAVAILSSPLFKMAIWAYMSVRA